jgi:dynactin-6
LERVLLTKSGRNSTGTLPGIESPKIGDYNQFGICSRVSPHVSIESNCSIGAGCIVLPSPFPSTSSATTLDTTITNLGGEETEGEAQSLETLSSFTSVFGSDNRRRTNDSGEGTVQEKALFVKHLGYLSETLPRFFKLKMF